MKMVEVEVLERVVRDKADRGKHFAYIGGLHAVVGFIKNGEIPTVDAVPVVHGRWVWNEEDECWVCSICELSALNNYRGISVDSEYCPNCGAKMDEGVQGNV